MNDNLREELEKYRNLVPVNKHRLDDELEIQSDVQVRLGGFAASAEARMNEAKDKLARTEARLELDLREEHSDRKLTKDEVGATVVRHKERVAAFDAYQEALHLHNQWARLYDAWKTRMSVMQALARLYSDNYWSSDSVSPGRKKRDEDTDERRAEIRRAHGPLSEYTTRADAEQPRRRRVVE